eukprot:COSAG05_NODE_16167_length_352_cov_0.806324_1_plen_55_part_10
MKMYPLAIATGLMLVAGAAAQPRPVESPCFKELMAHCSAERKECIGAKGCPVGTL